MKTYECDVCGDSILFPLNNVWPFKIKGIDKQLHCDDDCREAVLKISNEGKNWERLPDGPLRRAYEKQFPKGFSK